MSIVYQVKNFAAKFDREYEDKANAVAKAESFPDAELVTWNVMPNLPNALPAMRYYSCALNVWEGGEWRGINIHA